MCVCDVPPHLGSSGRSWRAGDSVETMRTGRPSTSDTHSLQDSGRDAATTLSFQIYDCVRNKDTPIEVSTKALANTFTVDLGAASSSKGRANDGLPGKPRVTCPLASTCVVSSAWPG